MKKKVISLSHLGHASLLFTTERTSILFDPVLNQFHHEGLYMIWPERLADFQELPEIEIIVISHRHPDHFDLDSLIRFPRNIPIVVPDDQVIISALAELGFKHLIVAQSLRPIEIQDTTLTPTPAAMDAIENGYVIESNGIKIWNLIDTVPRSSDISLVNSFLGPFDLAIVPWQPLIDVSFSQGKEFEFPIGQYKRLVENALQIDSRYLALGMGDLEKKNFQAIAKAMNKDVREVIEISEIIFGMEPKPGRAFLKSDTQFITPDVYVYKVGEEYVVSLNEDGLPRLRISNLYRNLLKGDDKSSQTKNTQDYVQDKLRSAIWLIKSIHQRQRTIYKVAESIVKHQTEFFEKGPAFIKPMILRDIANDIGMHESTVSRVTTSKYMHTPRGIFELKYFFNSGISKTDGDAVASESVKVRIQELVDGEDPKNPLSDQKIVEILKKEGIDIARRTVAKYRDILKILPSSKRKKYF